MTTTTGEGWARWRHLLLTTIAALLAAAFASGLHLALDALPGPEQHPPPWLSALPILLAALVAASLLVWGVLAWKSRATRRGWPLFGLGLLHLATVGAGLLAILLSDPEFLFGKSYRDTLRLDDGRVAHLYTTGLFCGYEVYEERSGQIWIERVERLSRACSTTTTLGWSARDGYTVYGPDGAELPYKNTNIAGLLAPH